MLAKFEPASDFDNDVASFKTLVPWIGPEAYFNIIFYPAPERLLSEVANKLMFPPVLTDLLRNSRDWGVPLRQVGGVHRSPRWQNLEF